MNSNLKIYGPALSIMLWLGLIHVDKYVIVGVSDLSLNKRGHHIFLICVFITIAYNLLQGHNRCKYFGGEWFCFHEHDDVIKWEHFPRNWPFVRGIHWSPHKGQWRGALMFSFICVWINDWVNNREAGDLRRHRGHYDVNVMKTMNMSV